MNLGSTIKGLRQKKGLKQIQLSEKCSISQTYLSQIESNSKEPHLSVLKDISKHLSIPLPILFFLSIDENDISPQKKDAFKMISQPVKSLFSEFFISKAND